MNIRDLTLEEVMFLKLMRGREIKITNDIVNDVLTSEYQYRTDISNILKRFAFPMGKEAFDTDVTYLRSIVSVLFDCIEYLSSGKYVHVAVSKLLNQRKELEHEFCWDLYSFYKVQSIKEYTGTLEKLLRFIDCLYKVIHSMV